MFFLITPTERCNLRCRYCDPAGVRQRQEKGRVLDLEALKRFLARIRERYGSVSIELYGGEPLLEPDLCDRILAECDAEHRGIQTNGLLLHRLSSRSLERLDAIYVSIDGPEDITDRNRGAGTYRRVRSNLIDLGSRGFSGLLAARPTVTPGMDVVGSVSHFMGDCDVRFDAVHWQLDAMFRREMWVEGGAEIREWFRSSYDPGISTLAEKWVERIRTERTLHNLVPFTGLLLGHLTGRTTGYLRCGAGRNLFAIAADGSLHPCPVFAVHDRHRLGDIRDPEVDLTAARDLLGAPCPECSVRGICGGRCLFANTEKLWGDEGFEVVCESVKHLVETIRGHVPEVLGLLAADRSLQRQLDVAAVGQFEVIP